MNKLEVAMKVHAFKMNIYFLLYLCKMKILMVCLGNICRSPLADGLLKAKIEARQLTDIVDSAGTSSFHAGEKPDARMIATANSYGVSLSHLRARGFETKDFDLFDRIFVMDQSNLQNVLKLSRTEADRNKVDLLLNLSHPGKNLEVPDPYYGGDEGFHAVYKMVDEATDVLIKQLEENDR